METDKPAGDQPDTNALQAQCLRLRTQLLAVLALVIVVSGTFNIYLWRQGKQKKAELVSLQQQVGPMFAEYNQMAPKMDEFIKKITDYGRTHPDFGPIMVKYGLISNTVPTAAPAPAPAPKK
jgi:hypothetical protein